MTSERDQRRPASDETTVFQRPPQGSPTGRAPAGESTPPAWRNVGGNLDELLTRDRRGTVYRSRGPRRSWKTIAAAAAFLAAVAVIAGLIAATLIAGWLRV